MLTLVPSGDNDEYTHHELSSLFTNTQGHVPLLAHAQVSIVMWQ